MTETGETGERDERESEIEMLFPVTYLNGRNGAGEIDRFAHPKGWRLLLLMKMRMIGSLLVGGRGKSDPSGREAKGETNFGLQDGLFGTVGSGGFRGNSRLIDQREPR